MSYRTLLIGALLAIGSGFAVPASADIISVDGGLDVAKSGDAPHRGMTMGEVSSKFGAPTSKVPAVGKPPISRWEYASFVVYFEGDHVIHSVVSESAAPAPASAAPAPASAPGPSSADDAAPSP